MFWNNLIDFCFYLFGGRGEGKKTADCLRTALKEYDLKFATILNDPDLASFRVLPEFKELQEEVFSSVSTLLVIILGAGGCAFLK